jgi:hypothetical protein
MNRLLATLALLCCLASPGVQAQTVSAPTTAVFAQSDADFALTVSYHVDFYQCASVVAGACVGASTTPFSTGVTVQQGNVIPLTPPDSAGNNRQFSLVDHGPVQAFLLTMPVTAAFVGTIQATGVTGVISPISALSDVFYPAHQLAVPGSFTIK